MQRLCIFWPIALSVAPVIDVIIPAYNASATIGHAVATCLAQRDVASVIVVDDCSADNTADAAYAAASGDSRLKVERFAQNRGPAAARNHAFTLAQAPLVALVDADDWVLPGRFQTLLATTQGWDFVADNILFVPEAIKSEPFPQAVLDGLADQRRPLGLVEFIDRNISRRGRKRSELGFLKPLFRRELLALHDLGYAENVRLGEDFILYVKAMARGARFMLSQRCGYVAIERAGSLSGQHSISDLQAFLSASTLLAGEAGLSQAEREKLQAHAASIAVRIKHREFLERKKNGGIAKAIAPLVSYPADLLHVLREIVKDKRDVLRPTATPRWRLLLNANDFD
jgi:succinoglycan biosynthesis protein ExoU